MRLVQQIRLKRIAALDKPECQNVFFFSCRPPERTAMQGPLRRSGEILVRYAVRRRMLVRCLRCRHRQAWSREVRSPLRGGPHQVLRWNLRFQCLQDRWVGEIKQSNLFFGSGGGDISYRNSFPERKMPLRHGTPFADEPMICPRPAFLMCSPSTLM